MNSSFAPGTVRAEISSAWPTQVGKEAAQEGLPGAAPADGACPFWLPSSQRCAEVLRVGLNCLASAPLTPPVSVSLRFATSAESSELNDAYRSKAKPTNVLSFPVANLSGEAWPCATLDEDESLSDAALLGDLVFCPEIIAAEALQQGKAIADHWCHLVLHGLFHLLGYDHLTEADADEMEALEIRALESLGIANPYLLD